MSLKFRHRYLLPLYVLLAIVQAGILAGFVPDSGVSPAQGIWQRVVTDDPSALDLNPEEWSRRTHGAFASSLDTLPAENEPLTTRAQEVAAIVLLAD